MSQESILFYILMFMMWSVRTIDRQIISHGKYCMSCVKNITEKKNAIYNTRGMIDLSAHNYV